MPKELGERPARELKTITINTSGYSVPVKKVDKRSVYITADEDMHIVAIEHFIGVGKGQFSDNGHMLSKSSDNPWVKWEKPFGAGMEPTGTKGYLGYCGRDYYSEVSGSSDVIMYESFPSGYFLVKKGEKLYMHCYANPFVTDGVFHHKVCLIYW